MEKNALDAYLIVGAALFCIGVYGVLTRRNAVAILMAIELMLNAANVNLVAFARYSDPVFIEGHTFAIMVTSLVSGFADLTRLDPKATTPDTLTRALSALWIGVQR